MSFGIGKVTSKVVEQAKKLETSSRCSDHALIKVLNEKNNKAIADAWTKNPATDGTAIPKVSLGSTSKFSNTIIDDVIKLQGERAFILKGHINKSEYFTVVVDPGKKTVDYVMNRFPGPRLEPSPIKGGDIGQVREGLEWALSKERDPYTKKMLNEAIDVLNAL